MLAGFLQPNTRYVVLRAFDNVAPGETLTFVHMSTGFDPHLSCRLHDALFVEKTLRAYEPVTADAPDEILLHPERFLRPAGPAPDDADTLEQRLADRQAQERADYVARDRARMLADAQRRLEKHRQKAGH